MTTFGPTFARDLNAAGLGGGLAWTADSIIGRDNLSPEDQALLDAVIAAHDPETELAKRVLSFIEFLDLFTPAEQLLMMQARNDFTNFKLWYDKSIAVQFIDLDDPRTNTRLQLLVDATLITAERKAAVMAGEAPSTTEQGRLQCRRHEVPRTAGCALVGSD